MDNCGPMHSGYSLNTQPALASDECGPAASVPLSRRVSAETLWITLICLLDLVTTLYWVTHGMAQEGNPVLAYFLDMGIAPFILAKVVTFVPAIVVAEWYRPHNPALITRAMRWVIAGYLVIYVSGVGAHQGDAVEFWRQTLLG